MKEEELAILNQIVKAYLEFADLQAQGRRFMTIKDWLESVLILSDKLANRAEQDFEKVFTFFSWHNTNSIG